MCASRAWTATTVDPPASIRVHDPPRSHKSAPGRYGSPLARRDHYPRSANRLAAARGKEFRDRQLIGVEQVDNDGVGAREGGALDAVDEIEKTKRGGSALTENTEVAVSPTGPFPASAVITATPAG